MQDFSSPTRDEPGPLQGEWGALTTGPPGNSHISPFWCPCSPATTAQRKERNCCGSQFGEAHWKGSSMPQGPPTVADQGSDTTPHWPICLYGPSCWGWFSHFLMLKSHNNISWCENYIRYTSASVNKVTWTQPHSFNHSCTHATVSELSSCDKYIYCLSLHRKSLLASGVPCCIILGP